jgi:hypothetical protein
VNQKQYKHLSAMCQCGKVKFEAVGPPILTASCYCTSCQEAGRQFERLASAPPDIKQQTKALVPRRIIDANQPGGRSWAFQTATLVSRSGSHILFDHLVGSSRFISISHLQCSAPSGDNTCCLHESAVSQSVTSACHLLVGVN